MHTFKVSLALFIASVLIISCQKDDLGNFKPVVNAGNDTTITINSATDSILLKGSAIDQDGTIEGYIWGQISGPNTVTIVSSASATTAVKGLTSGNYSFQLMATDDKGATGVKSVAITIIKQSNINLSSGLLAYYPFNNNYNDASGNGNHGTLSIYGGSLTTDHKGANNSAFNVNSSGQELIVNNHGNITFDSVLSVSMNVLTRGRGRYMYLGLIDYTTGYGQSFGLGTGEPGAANFSFSVTNQNNSCNTWIQPSQVSGTLTSYIAPIGVWNNYISIFNRGILKVFLNGVLIHEETARDKALKLCAGTELIIGGWWQNDPAASHNGKIDEVRLYNRDLNIDEIKELSKDFR